ncbi:MAG: hypothetical protein JRF63_02545 [Deltaproteobacteria bacterium]|nr:hypothetical protein [Deltaproteobacteria bacterium]
MSHAIACCGQRHQHKHSGARHGIVFAITLVTAGALFLAQHLGYLGDYVAWQFWPLALVFLGISNQVGRVGIGSRIWGLALLVGGGLGLAHTLGLADVRWDLIWPVGLVALGVVVLLGIFAARKHRRDHGGSVAPGSVSGSTVMGERKERWDDQQFDGGAIKAVMGTLDIDLSDARMKGNEACLRVKVVMGEVKLRVPREWQVQVAGSPMLGEVQDRTRPYPQGEGERPRLVLECDVVMGSLEISD